MRAILLAGLLLAAPAFAGTRVATAPDGDYMRLHDTTCSHAGTLALIPPGMRPRFYNARLRIDGQDVFDCWAPGGPSVLIVLEDGRAAHFPADIFAEEPGV